MKEAVARMGVCAPDKVVVQAMVTELARRLVAELGPVVVTGGVIERDSLACAELRQQAPASMCWAVLDKHPTAVLVVAYADAPEVH